MTKFTQITARQLYIIHLGYCIPLVPLLQFFNMFENVSKNS